MSSLSDCSTADLGSKLCLCVLNVCLVCIGPGMVVDCEFTK